MKKPSRFLHTPVEPFAVERGLTADNVLARMERISFQGRNLATARHVWQKMLEDDVTIFMGMAGALSAGGCCIRTQRTVKLRATCHKLSCSSWLNASGLVIAISKA